ncbi:phage tail assembly chaperone [Lysinibacillus sp. FSL M8-0134]|uniref:phage tail assembly chaperone n=1 Tax=Lysinibacillus sp. FSL M8-0134 TaxID=2921717 RepID=UPI00311992AD
MSNLAAFFAHNKKQNGNIKRAISKSFVDEQGKPIEWEFAPVSPERDAELKFECTKRSMITQGKRKGQFNTDFDHFKYQRLLTVESIVFPNLNDKELQDSYKAMGADALLGKMLTIGEIADASAAAQEANGYEADLEDLVEEVKN